ncbi:hypothetical protein [Halalkalibacterium halodurans]|uniref:Uncharacterized protein n=1 Tax=Halalkalibacterium halodurans TaxID=86665 RepID=A0A0M0KM82_ALKHA|nr:hypothetical protein [Halalkalibacterium halodurans]TPE70650.1 hypothetical protein AMD02_001385 [Halalkalibacterium halodurans]
MKQAEEQAEKERKAKEELKANYEKLEKHSKSHEELVEKLRKESNKKEGAADEKKVKQLQDSLSAQKTEITKYKERIKKLEEDLKKKPAEGPPKEVIPESVKKELADLRAKVKIQDNGAAVKFSVVFDSLVSNFKELLSTLDGVKKTDPELYQKFKGAIKGLLSKMSERL